MFSKHFIKRLAIVAGSAILSLSTFHSAYAKPGTLVNAPLFLATVVDPNVFFTLDDSGSMDWGPMVRNGTAGISSTSGLPIIEGDDRAYYAPTLSRLYTSRGYLPPSDVDPASLSYTGDWNSSSAADVAQSLANLIAEWNRGWVVRNHIGNRTYYNPSVTYNPWPGLESDGTPMYEDADPKAALRHPDQPGGQSVDLTARYTFTSNNWSDSLNGNDAIRITTTDYYIPVYYIWSDTNTDPLLNGNGVIDQTDDRKRVEIPADANDPEMQNFANWFQYHRSRMNSTKYIIGSTINSAETTRMGMRWFNTGHEEDIKTMTNDQNKRDLMEDLYEFVTPARSTPARRALRDTGRYFDRNDGYTWGPEPILSAAQGGECQQNFNILMSDGFWNGNSPFVGNTDRDVSSSQEKGINPNDPPPQTAKYFDGDETESVDGGNYEDPWTDTLADVAMHYYENDLADNLTNNVRAQPGIDLATHQHLVTYTIAFGLDGSLDPTVDPASPAFPGWPQPVANTNTTVDDMWHAAYNGRGLYLNAQDPQALVDSLDAALSDIAERTATAAAVAINSAKLTTESIVYLANFNTNGWQGDLSAFKIKTDPVTGKPVASGELEDLPVWSAAAELDGRNLATNPRDVMTYNGSKGVEFIWDNLSAAQQADLKTSPTGATESDDDGKARLEYLKGSSADEGNNGRNYRQRKSRLADLVNSGPVYVGEPALNWPDRAPFPTAVGKRYSDFKNGPAKNRTPMVYAGSNGGFMHGFDASSNAFQWGQEKMAYVANFLFSSNIGEGLHYLTDPGYTHRYYNDLTPSLSDVYDGSDWQTVLISGVRGGGRGIFALDVTDPSLFDNPAGNADKIVMWEFTNADDPDLGYTYSRPQIGLSNASDGSWVAIFGNGYNNTGDGKAKLFILRIHQGTDGNWVANSDYLEIPAWVNAADGDNDPNTDSDGDGDNDDRNGLSSPALADLDGNGTIDRAYAGDLNGKMWAFDLSSSDPGQWKLDYGEPLFTTINNEPITAQPTLSRHPSIVSDGSNDPNVMVFFGSGQFLVDSDKVSTNTNYFYGVWDRGDLGGGVTSNDLQRQTYENGFVDNNGDPVRVLSRNPVNYIGGERGWYFDLPDPSGRERSITRPVVRGDVVFFNTYVPDDDPCAPKGYGYRMAVDLETGGSPDDPTFDVNEDGIVDENDRASNGAAVSTVVGLKQEGFLPEPVFIEDIAYTADTPSKVAKLKTIPKGRLSWQELIQ